MIRAVIFDMDDTLIETQRAKFAAHQYTAKHFYNLELTIEELQLHWGKPFDRMLLDLYQHIDSYDNLLSNYLSTAGEFPISAYPGALATVTNLSRSHLLGLVTAANHQLTHLAMADAQIPISLFSYVQTCDDTPFHKPDPQVFSNLLLYCGERGISRDEVLYIGDKLDDYQASLGAGLNFLAIAGHTTSLADFASAGAKTIGDLSEISSYLN